MTAEEYFGQKENPEKETRHRINFSYYKNEKKQIKSEINILDLAMKL